MKQMSLALIFCVSASGVLAADITFPIKNSGAADLISFQYSESGANSWGEVFDGDKLASGQSTEVVLRDYSTCVFDIKAEFSDGSTMSDSAVNLCEMGGGYDFQ